MGARITKIAALAIAGVVAATTIGAATPALANGWGHHGGWGHGGGWGRPGWGYGGGYGWRGGHRGYGWGAPVAAGVLGALAVGAIAGAAAQPHYGYGGGYGYGGCYPANQPVVDGWGNVVAYRRVQVCD
ncbi:MAG TPA: hypothetical protein VIF40_15185 [Methylosinus sp.]|jgi:hypothetical protein|uniref:hypothetical protein n=1 Tax=Methylosinus sp. TaxID=427 RepID=UPI002F93F976